LDDQEQAPPLEELDPPPMAAAPPTPRQPSTSTRTTPIPHRGRQPINREPSVGTDRYEEIIVETRKRSLSRPGSRVGSRMGSRAGSQMDFTLNSGGASIGKLDLESLRNSTKSICALDLDTKQIVEAKTSATPEVVRKISTPVPPPQPATEPEFTLPKPVTPTPPPPPQAQKQPKQPMALDANQNATAPTLPAIQPLKLRSKTPRNPDPLAKFFPKNIPDWFVITYTYSVVMILILLLANTTPDGKLYIHFTALWSLVIYSILEEDQDDDIVDGAIRGIFKIK